MNVLKYISQSRAQLMALAIIGVLFVHSGIKLPWSLANFFVQIGHGGVDIFFFLSGFGLYYSCKKDCNYLRFVTKRLKRIFPAYVICILATQLIDEGAIDWTKLWQDCLFIGYWIKPLEWDSFAWFVSGIMGLYLIFPLYFRVFRRYPFGATLNASLTGLFFANVYSYYFLVLYPNECNDFIHLFTRTPLFFLGVLAAEMYERERKGDYVMDKTTLFVLLILPYVGYKLFGVVTTIGLSYNQLRNAGYTFYPFIVIVPGFTIAMGFLMAQLPKIVRTMMAWVGNSTLEAYLLLGLVFEYRKWFVNLCGGSNIAGCIMMMMACIIISCALHYSLDFVMSLKSRIQKQNNVIESINQ